MQLPQNYDEMTSAQRYDVKREYIRLQNNLCFFCNRSLNLTPVDDCPELDWSLFPGGKEGFLKWPIHLQHCHYSGMTEGAVHAFCNAKWWYLYGR